MTKPKRNTKARARYEYEKGKVQAIFPRFRPRRFGRSLTIKRKYPRSTAVQNRYMGLSSAVSVPLTSGKIRKILLVNIRL